MDAEKLFIAIEVISLMYIGDARPILLRKIKEGLVSEEDGWVAAALGCVNEADMVATACEFLLADCREGYVKEDADGSDLGTKRTKTE